MKLAFKRLALMSARLLLAVAAHAQTLMSVVYNPVTAIPYTTTDWAGSLLFPQFNSSLGTLTEVDIDVSSGLDDAHCR